jgi:predicted metal-dependent hydrolase
MMADLDRTDVLPIIRRFLELYEAGRFWDSHEVLEEPWRDNRSDFLQGLILYASAWVHWERGNAHGVRAQLRKARTRLSGYPDHYLGLDVRAIREHCTTVRDHVSSDPDGWPERISPLPLALARERLRGDEAELSTF